MIARMSGAVLRGFLVALMIAIPALVVPGMSVETSQATVLIALLAAVMTFIEYNARSPSIVEFRDAAPFNRLRFAALLTTVFLLSMICRGKLEPTLLTNALTSVGTIIGNSIDFPYSPVRLVVLMLPPDSDDSVVQSVRTAAGLSYLISLTAMAMFLFLVRVLGWPSRNGSFNVWINLPLFDPTAGGDVLHRLNRDARINIALGFLLPFIIPAVVKMTADLLNPITLENPQTLIWTMSAWAFLPASMIMRGIAMQRIADMIKDQRKRAYANADADMLLA
ncbi:hypothetical protein [Tateyamaria sp. ANG-S1]|uniref:hypothetical protein n=1 Tax=Tateyamaria sp. ANG-S1 TaxID=1577905 RepID=UPI00057EC052|nr:hypothetical protein [Tateyamaria sp. ANG-S1]KIC49518.1 membrane protein [Tateyamaria sp. ANG-S1]